MEVGDRVVVVRHPGLRPVDLWGYDGHIVGTFEGGYLVRMPWLVKTLQCASWILKPCAGDCEIEGCDYGIWIKGRCAWHQNDENLP
jgi:hypothetical protein